MAVTIAVPNNYVPTTIYPLLTRYASKYTIFPYNNGGSTAVEQPVTINKYTTVTIPGYPRPNPIGKGKADSPEKNAMNATHDQWRKTVTLTWYPQIYDTEHVNTDGKWIIFRKIQSSSDDYTKIGEVAYSKYGNNKCTFVDNDQSKLYDIEYRYVVVFQPNEWNKQLTSPSEASELSYHVLKTMSKTDPLQSLTPSTTLSNKVEITCTFHTLKDAGTDANNGQKTYTLNLYRCTPTTNWSKDPIATYNVNDTTESEVVFTDTDVSPCVTYKYKVEIKALEKTFSLISTTSGSISGSTEVSSVSASRGTYAGTVHLTWNVNQVGTSPTYFNVQRRLLNSKNENDFLTIYTTSGIALTYNYEDNTAQPGTYYEYRVQCYRECTTGGKTEYSDGGSRRTDGFAMATGIISGRVSYGTGTAVNGVKVNLEPSSTDGESLNTFHSMRIDGTKSCVLIDKSAPKDTAEYFSFFSKPWTVQMYYRSDSLRNSRNSFFDSGIMSMCGYEGKIYYIAENYYFDSKTNKWKSTGLWYDTGLNISKGKYYNISFTYNNANADSMFIIRLIDEEGQMKKKVFKASDEPYEYYNKCINNSAVKEQVKRLIYFGNAGKGNLIYGIGNIDECRLWGKALTDAELMSNYNRVLSGSEDRLKVYYKFDEGIENPSIAYDYSKTGGVSNGNHGTVMSMNISEIIPNKDQLSICGLTDVNGNYTISGIPFSGDGTSYTIRPTMGVHEFSPSKSSRFVSAQSIVHNGVDFTDVSSFPVSGAVYYLNTNIPVEGVSFTIDGTPCTKDGEYITSNSEGKFTISVPIGKHYISALKDGHVLINADTISFENRAYYPSPTIKGDEAVYNTKEFKEPIVDGLVFYDATLVPVAGRVVGGSIEDGKPVGFGLSRNNIGRAEIKLMYGGKKFNQIYKIDGAVKQFVNASQKRIFSIPEDANVNSTACADTVNSDTLTIVTDPKTGEFAAMLPPLTYDVMGIKVYKSDIAWDNTNDRIDASNPKKVDSDSIEVEGKYQYFDYVACFKKCYHSDPKLTITQHGAKTPGAFGESKLKITDDYGTSYNVMMYDTLATYNGVPVGATDGYVFDYPIFKQNGKYKFDIKLFEEYENKDDARPDATYDKTIVPMEGTRVTFANRLGAATKVYVGGENDGEIYEEGSEDVELDETGEGCYEWVAGLPYINGNHTRSMSAAFTIDGKTYSWPSNTTSFTGIILGELPSGNNFVTGGPDEVSMILRDPAGSGSNAYIEAGQTVTTTKTRAGRISSATDVTEHVSVGLKTTVISGVAAGALVATTVDTEVTVENSLGLRISEEVEIGETSTHTVTTTKRISTSDQPDYVGAVGDVFIGNATNYVFGNCRRVDIFMENDKNDPTIKVPQLLKKDLLSVGSSFGTEFAYTQYYVEEVLIPNFISLRNSNLIKVSPEVFNSGTYPPHSDKPLYITALDSLDERFGSNNFDKDIWGEEATQRGELNGPSYKMILPICAYSSNNTLNTNYNVQDTIAWYNAQIKAWEQILANNEEAKVKAIENRKDYLRNNYSFDTGSSISSSTLTSTSKDFTVTSNTAITAILGMKGGVKVNECGVMVEVSNETGAAMITADGETKEETMEVGFNLMESGFNDALSVDVLNAPDGFGPIFYTRAGQTSCPYEDEVVTKYYRPGFTIQQKTQQVEDPQITLDEGESSIKSDVPNGTQATYRIVLDNNSEVGEDCWFNLDVVDETNTHGASVSIDGLNITNGRTIYLPAGKQTKKTLVVTQTDPNIYDYKLDVRISSTCQPDDGVFPQIANTLTLEAHFKKTGSAVSLKTDENVINSTTGTDLHFNISDYNYNAEGLQSIQLQIQQEGDPRWTICKEWVKEGLPMESWQDILPMTASISDYLSLHDKTLYPDGNWNIRAITVSKFGTNDIVYNSSDVLSFSKDIMLPQLISKPSPSNGVLTADNEISLTFNEDIRQGALTDIDNFLVTGELNDADVLHDVALSLNADEGAKTEASIDLEKRSFAVNMWVRYSDPGELFAHGTEDNNMKVSVNDENKMVVKMGGNTYVSENTMLPDTWLFLSFSYDAEKESFNANYAYDAYSEVLFNKQSVGEYTGVGSLRLGRGLVGQIHDVSLWDNARAWSVAQGEMHEKKSRYTIGLMGYWPLDEGSGTTATDKARSRTLVLPSASAWHLEAKNYTLKLDGNVIMNAGAYCVDFAENDSYAIEMWFRADENQQDEASLFSYDMPDILDLYLDNDGKLNITNYGNNHVVTETDYRDNQWHHIAINVLKSTGGAATVYVDGVSKLQLSSYDMPVFSSGRMFFGGRVTHEGLPHRLYKGNIDELRIWKGYRNIDLLLKNRFTRVNSGENGLVLYFPFEKIGRDSGLLPTSDSTYDDMSGIDNEEMKRFVGDGQYSLVDVDCPPLKTVPMKQNVAFTFTANERKIVINLTEQPQRIEGCTVRVNVRDVRDTHNNKCSDITWDVFVRQNQLIWLNDEVTVMKRGAESVEFEVVIANNSGAIESWSLSDIPTWLSVNNTDGVLPAVTERTLKFTVDPGLTIGTHEAVLQLTGSLGISEPLVLKVVCTSETPEWSVNPADYEYSMNINGQLKVLDVISQDENDIVAAFRGDRCVGVAHPAYYARYDAYYVLMNVYGNAEDQAQPLTYKVFDASSGNIYPVISASISDVLTFSADKVIGTMSAPNYWSTSDEIEQVKSINKGWQWISFYVNPVNNSIGDVFSKVENLVSQIVSENAQWTPTSSGLSTIQSGKMYKSNLTDAAVLRVVGLPVDVRTTAVTINPMWNWIGYLTSGHISLNEAFADLNPQDGDVIKSQNAFATWNQTEWVGTLGAMTSGEGYQYFSSRATSQSFHYPSVSSMVKAPILSVNADERLNNQQNIQMKEITKDYMGNMNVIAKVIDFKGKERNDVEIRVMDADNVLRSVSLSSVADRYFLTIAGNDNGAALKVMVTVDGIDYVVPGVMFYKDDAIIGTLDEPLVIDLSSPTGIGNISADADNDEHSYNLGGQRIGNNAQRQVVIRGNKKMVVKQ